VFSLTALTAKSLETHALQYPTTLSVVHGPNADAVDLPTAELLQQQPDLVAKRQ